uniref:Uncharacterized protein n=1 Tax=Strongyloides stercoralis TaxID=6248 RepID=A0AAF5DGS3_STRER
MEAVVERIGGCCSTGAEPKTCKLFSFGRNSFSNNANYDKESRYYCCCFGDCCSNGTDSEAFRLFWKKLEDELEAVALLELNRKRVNVFFGRNSFRINASYNSETRNSFRINASYDNESRKNSSSNNTNYNRESRFPGISKECELEVKSYTDYLVKNKIQGFDVGQNADILYGANGCFNDYAKCLENKYVFTIKMGSRKMYNFGFMISKSYISNNKSGRNYYEIFLF